MLKRNEKFSRSELSYEARVIIFDTMCKGCPYAVYECVNIAPYTGNIEKKQYKTLQEALANFKNGNIARYCTFNDEKFSLKEITDNGCYFWGDGEADSGIFIEITEIERIKEIAKSRNRETVFTESNPE